MTEPIATNAPSKWQTPGFLLEPLGWILERVARAVESKPTLIEHLFNLSHARMHLTALTLAHLPGEIPPDVALAILRGPKKAALDLSLGYRPVGIDRALHQLPRKVLPAETYRKLVDLLNHPARQSFCITASRLTKK